MNLTRIGFIGLGQQGLAIALRLARQGARPAIWARRPEALAPFDDLDIRRPASAAELGAQCDLVGICVFDAAQVNDVLFGPTGVAHGMAPGGVVIVHSTVAPGDIVDIARRGAEHDLLIVDAPVSGGPDAAEAGTLAVMLGAPGDAVERCRPMLSVYADKILRVGDVGAGQLAKLLNNAVFTAQLGLGLDALRIGEAMGLTRDGLREAIRAGTRRSFSMDVLVGLPTAYELALSNATPTLTKDVALLERLVGDIDPGALLPAANHLLTTIAAAAATEPEGER